MRKTLIFSICLTAALSIFASIEASAQTAYGLSVVQYNPTPRTVTGLSATWLDYWAGLYYDPEVIGDIYRTDDVETSLDHGRMVGYADIIPAVVNLQTSNYVEGKTYCTFSQHAVYGYHYYVSGGSTWWFDPFRYSFMSGSTPWGGFPFTYYYTIPQRYRLGFTEACITIPFPNPTPTPTPGCLSSNPLGCEETPTPTPTPQPSPTVKLKEVGFKGDRPIRQLEVSGNPYIEEPTADGTVTTWRTDDNPDYPVAYMKGTDPVVFAKLTITPALQTSQSVLLRIKRGMGIVTSSNVTVNLVGSEVRTPDITIPFSNLESGQFIKKSEYKFTWEISFDNGSTWKELNKKSEHDVHWLNSNPPNEADFKPFRRASGEEYQGLFDKALEWSTGKIENNEPDVKKVIQRINQKLAAKVNYNPGAKPVTINPLEILRGANNGQAVCIDNALLLGGLLRSIGLESVQEQYHWGGDDTGKRNYFCPANLGCGTITSENPYGNRQTMQTKREQLGPSPVENVERDPAFRYHATVVQGSDRYDPSYGINQGIMELLTALKVVTGQAPQCVYNSQATALLYTSVDFRDDSLSANNNPNTLCNLVRSPFAVDVRNARFDGNGGADTAVLRPDDGFWGVMDETGGLLTIPAFATASSNDRLLAGDYDGDGLTDPAMWFANGDFQYNASSNYYKSVPMTAYQRDQSEIAVTGDYDGDGQTDIAAWRGSDGRYLYIESSTGNTTTVNWGGSSYGDLPVPGDYDGDGKTDIAVFRTSTGEWWIRKSSDLSAWVVTYGTTGDIPVQGDYDGDGKTDFVIARPSNGQWWFLKSESGYPSTVFSGPAFASDDWPVPADYNSDSKVDVAIWFKSTGTWFILDSQTGDVRTETFGRPEDTPVESLAVVRP